MDTSKVSVVYSCNDFIIAFKPHGIPTVPLKGQSTVTLLSETAKLFPAVMSVCGKNPWEGSALHRLDTATQGLVLFALTDSFMQYAQKIQAAGLMFKTYSAVSDVPLKDGEDLKKPFTVSTYFRAFGPGRKTVKPETDPLKADSKILYTTNVEALETSNDEVTFKCTITRGFRHQIRAHLSYIGHPIAGDALYNPQSKIKDLALTCTGLSFPLENSNNFSFSL